MSSLPVFKFTVFSMLQVGEYAAIERGQGHVPFSNSRVCLIHFFTKGLMLSTKIQGGKCESRGTPILKIGNVNY